MNPKTVTVGEQQGEITAGTEGVAGFTINTTGIAAGFHDITVANLPDGMVAGTLIGGLTLGRMYIQEDGSGIVMLYAEGTTHTAGTYDNLTLTIDGATSNTFTLKIEVVENIYYFTEKNAGETGFYTTKPDDPEGGTKLGDMFTDVQCMEYINGTLYGVDYNSNENNNLVRINFSTGALTVIAADIAADCIGMAVDPNTGKVYVSTWDFQFGTIDLATGAFTLITTWDQKFTIAIDNDGVCYAQEITGNLNTRFGTVNLATGAFTQLTTRTGEKVSYVQNMMVNRSTNELYWGMRDASIPGESTLVKIDKATGAYTVVGKFPRTVQSCVIMDK